MKEDVDQLISELKKKTKLVAMLAPSFIVNFDYPEIITMLKDLGIDKTVELTFGAKVVNHEYHKQLKKTKTLLISTVCPGIATTIKSQLPQYEKNLIRVVSPMIATARICKKIYPKHKTVFISPCYQKTKEAKEFDSARMASHSEHPKNAKRFFDVDIVIGMNELVEIFKKYKIKPKKGTNARFDKFYNDYTKIYPTSGGLSKTAHLRGIIRPDEVKVIDGIEEVMKFLKNPDKKIKFLDATFCIGSCIGGPLQNPNLTLEQKKRRVMDYVARAMHENIPETAKGVMKQARGIKLTY